jgi:DNA-binding response OmpR family regulator
VADTGRGIPKEKTGKIFDRFYRVNDSVSGNPEGTGLGLALTKELVELYRGEISVDSREGMGSTFTVKLPIAKDLFSGDEIVTQPEHASRSKELHKKHFDEPEDTYMDVEAANKMEGLDDSRPVVLIVEDNADIINYIARNLTEDYQVMTATNGEKGLQMATENIPDLVISDVMMPVMDGVEMSRHIKTDERTNHIPVIILTAKADKDSKLKGLETGVDDYLIKPFDPEELRFRVKNLLEQRELLREKFRKEFSLNPDFQEVSSPSDDFTKKIFDLLDQHIEDPEYSVEQLSGELNLSRSQVFRKLTAVTGYPPNELLRNLRLKKAAFLFHSGHKNIAQVMYQVGFNNPSYFAKCFHKLYGLNPSQYIIQAGSREH